MENLIRKVSTAYYGWYVIAALFFTIFIGVGVRGSYGVFVKTWEDEFGASVTLISVAASLGWLMNGASQPIFGNLTDRYGGRPVIILSMIPMGLGAIAMAFVTNAYMLIFMYGFVISFFSGGIMFSTGGPVVAAWFRAKRGTAMSILAAGGSVGGLILVPFAAYLLIQFSWQTAWVVMGVIMLALGVPLLILVLKSRPEDMGLQQDGYTAPRDVFATPPQEALSGPLATDRWQDSYSSAPMWQLSMAYVVCGITTASISVHYVRWAVDQDISAGKAAIAFGLLMGINAIGVLTIGYLSDKMPRKTLLGIVYLIRSLAFLSFLVLPAGVALWAFAIIGGASWLATVPLTTSLTADVYGVKALGTLSGLINLAHQLGGAGAVLAFGIVFDRFDTYDPAFFGGFLTLLAAGVISLSINERKYSGRYMKPGDTVLQPIEGD
ncbi:MAG: MFS transporter [Chloroflexi bacterium]|nr:MFS transporter [Chloroflexota bacterium]